MSSCEQLQGKRIGLVTNPTGVDRYLNSTIDVLHSAPGVELVALFGPEHGVRGNAHAGEHVEGQAVDPRTGIPIFSLYGKTRLPSAEQFKGLDAIVYDIQDIGCRSYTYISRLRHPGHRLPLLHLHQHHGQCDEGGGNGRGGDDYPRPSESARRPEGRAWRTRSFHL